MVRPRGDNHDTVVHVSGTLSGQARSLRWADWGEQGRSLSLCCSGEQSTPSRLPGYLASDAGSRHSLGTVLPFGEEARPCARVALLAVSFLPVRSSFYCFISTGFPMDLYIKDFSPLVLVGDRIGMSRFLSPPLFRENEYKISYEETVNYLAFFIFSFLS